MDKETVVYRCEYKYLLDFKSFSQINKKISFLLSPDEHSDINGYMVRSLYFDTPHDTDLLTKLHGLNYGKKIRLRIYSPDDQYCKLELKEKGGIYRKKTSVSLNRTEAEEIIDGNYSVLLKSDTPSSLRLYTAIEKECYRPKVLIEYFRKAYKHPVNNTRVTFDYGLKSIENYYDIFNYHPPYLFCDNFKVIMEVKFNQRLPEMISSILEDSMLQQISFSKYAESRGFPIKHCTGGI